MKKFRLRVLQDEEVLGFIDKDCVRNSWTALADKSDKHVVLQRWEFVRTWYMHYHIVYKPLFLIGYNFEEEVVGILPLAIHLQTNNLCVAGDEHAEYHGWLCEEKYEESFILKCLCYLKEQTGVKKWKINYLAPNTRVDFLSPQNLKKIGVSVELIPSEDPLWDLEDTKKLKKINKRANVKRSFRYFREQGNLVLKRIQHFENHRPLLEELAKQNDFKKEALYNTRGFKEDPYFLNFLESILQYPEINHFSVLYLDDIPLAFNHAFIQKDELCLASTAYNPTNSRNSPGKLHLLELASSCQNEQINTFDLTPGKDSYKSRFSNKRRKVYQVNFYFSLRAKIKAYITKLIKRFIESLLKKCDLDIKDVKYRFNDFRVRITRILRFGPKNIFHELGQFFYKKKYYALFKYTQAKSAHNISPLPSNWEITENDFHDLLIYDEPEGYISRKDLYLECLDKFSKGDSMFCLKKHGELRAMAWIRNGKYAVHLHSTNHVEEFPDQASIIYGFREFGKELTLREVEALYNSMAQRLTQNGIKDIYQIENKEGQTSSGYQTNMMMIFKKDFHRFLSRHYYINNRKYL